MSDKLIAAMIVFGLLSVVAIISMVAFTHVDRYYVSSTQTR